MAKALNPSPEASFDELTKLIHWLCEQWVAYRDIFGHSPERTNELNKRTGLIFLHIHSQFVDAILLGIANAFDGDERTLSLRTAIGQLPETSADTKERKDNLTARCAALEQRCNSVLQHRHCRIAHVNKKVVFGDRPLPDVSRDDMKVAIDGIKNLCDDISLALSDGENGFEFHGAEIDMAPSCQMLIDVVHAGNHLLDSKEKERLDLLEKLGRNEQIESVQQKLAETLGWFNWGARASHETEG